MTKRNSNIAIFGATGHIGKNISFYFSQNRKNNLILFGRNKGKIQNTMNKIIPDNSYSFCRYNEFERKKYDVIINCIGIGDPGAILKNKNILEITEYYDNKILDYIKRKKSTVYVNFSSGAIYGHRFKSPVSESTSALLDVNKPNSDNYYAISKIYSEAKHRKLNNLNIIDLRLFSFFSRFIDLKTEFLMSQITNSIKHNKKFVTDKNNIIRDYIHPQDLFQIINECIKKERINMVFDVSSKKSINKFDLLKSLSKKYGLKYVIQKNKQTSPTGFKSKYYSKSKKIIDLGIIPKYSSLQTIFMELGHIIKPNV